MSEHLVFIDTFRIRPGRTEEFRQAAAQICAAVSAGEPRILAYTIYVSDDGSEGTGLQVHPDFASVKQHRVVMAAEFGRIMELAEIVRMEVYGPLAEHRLQQIRDTAKLFGDVPVTARNLTAGFFRTAPPETQPQS
jgi:quinol monooxygenase YgiN